MEIDEIKSLLAECADPKLIASASNGTEKLWKINALVVDLRGEVRDLELQADLHLNELLKHGQGVEMQKSNWKVSETYKEWKFKLGLLQDVRAIRRQMERHTDLLIQQEKFRPTNRAYLG